MKSLTAQSVKFWQVQLMENVTYGKCYIWQRYYGKCNYGKDIMANETEPRFFSTGSVLVFKFISE